MKIIKQGKRPGEKTYTWTCNACSTEFEFQEQEGTVRHDQRDGSWVEINCPVCGQKQYVDYKGK